MIPVHVLKGPNLDLLGWQAPELGASHKQGIRRDLFQKRQASRGRSSRGGLTAGRATGPDAVQTLQEDGQPSRRRLLALREGCAWSGMRALQVHLPNID